MKTTLRFALLVVSLPILSACSPAMKLAEDAGNGNAVAVKADLANTPPDVTITGRTALGYAAANGRLEVVKVLLAAGAKPDLTDKQGVTPLIQAAGGMGSGRDYPGVVAALIAAGANVNAKDSIGNTPIGQAAMLGQPGVVPILARAGANLNEATPVDTPLTQAAAAGNIPMVVALMDSGADVNASNPRGICALDEASEHGQLEAVKLLIRKGAKVDGSIFYVTPLGIAATDGHLDVVVALIDAGADPNRGHTTPMTDAKAAGHEDVADYLAEHGGHP